VETHNVTFVHGEGMENEVVKVDFNKKVAATSKKEGYTVAWYKDEACTELFDFETPITEDITLYAKYTINTYTVTFVHGGDIADVEVQVNHNEKVNAEEGKKAGYTVAWYTDEACTKAFDFDTAITGNLKLYANYTLIEDSSSDETSSSDENSSSDETSSSDENSSSDETSSSDENSSSDETSSSDKASSSDETSSSKVDSSSQNGSNGIMGIFGCKSTVGTAVATGILASAAVSALLLRKKKDDNE
jgi:uncharacterized repeat protein (TIGR02543 family)